MTTFTRDSLAVSGTKLYYEVRGSGPVLLMISGGPADADVFAGLAGALSDRYTVVTYDTRGNSRSSIDNPTLDQPIELEADDAEQLLSAVTREPAFVFGSSGGGIVGLDLVVRCPDLVSVLVAHEPPVMELLPDAAAHRAQARHVYDTYLESGIGAAMMEFMRGAGLEPPPAPVGEPNPETQASMARAMNNFEHFVAHRLLPMGEYALDIEALRAAAPRIVIGIGADSGGQPAACAGLALAERLGQPALEFPGDHGGFVSDPRAFADALHEVLTRTLAVRSSARLVC